MEMGLIAAAKGLAMSEAAAAAAAELLAEKNEAWDGDSSGKLVTHPSLVSHGQPSFYTLLSVYHSTSL